MPEALFIHAPRLAIKAVHEQPEWQLRRPIGPADIGGKSVFTEDDNHSVATNRILGLVSNVSFGSDSNVRHIVFDRILPLIRTAFSVGSARVFSIGLFVLSARTLSTAENSDFIFAIAVPQLVTQLATLGWLPLIRREVSRMPQTSSPAAKGFITRSFQVPMVSTLIAASIFFAATTIWRSGEGAAYLALVAGLCLAQALSSILREYLAALSKPALAIVYAESLPFALTCVCIWSLAPLTVAEAVSIFALGTGLAILLQSFVVFQFLAKHLREETATYKTKEWFRYGFFSLLGFGGRAILDRLDVIILGLFSLSSGLALFNSSLRMTSLILLAPVIMLPVFSPHISKAHESGDLAQVRRDMFLQTALIAVTVLPLAALMIIFPSEITTALFGEDYRDAGWLLGCLVFSQVMFAFSLPWSNFFLMTSGEKIYGLTHMLALALALAICLSQIGSMGLMSIAIAMTSANTVLFTAFFIVGAIRLTNRSNTA